MIVNDISIGTIATVIASLLAMITSLINRKHLHEIKIQINGRIDQLLKLTAVASKDEGIREEKERREILGS